MKRQLWNNICPPKADESGSPELRRSNFEEKLNADDEGEAAGLYEPQNLHFGERSSAGNIDEGAGPFAPQRLTFGENSNADVADDERSNEIYTPTKILSTAKVS